MTIGIDARLIDETGVGRYIRNLITALGEIDRTNTYVVYLKKKSYDAFVCPNQRWQKRCTDIHWHTVKEQFVMPFFFLKDHLDLLHVPYFTIPLWYPKKFILTIHDLTVFHESTGKATTLPYPLYALKKIGYMVQLWVGLRRAHHIIAVSESTKKELITHFGIQPEKISVTYEGVDRQFLIKEKRSMMKDQRKTKKQKNPYFLYVGNAYPHKNLETLIQAFAEFLQKKKEHESYRLLLVGKHDYFYDRLRVFVQKSHLETHVLFLGSVSDEELQELYEDACAFVFPSRMEGFGLPVLEALVSGCPVIVSDIPVFHELFGTLPQYFALDDIPSLTNQLMVASTASARVDEKTKDTLLHQFSWQTMAKQTMVVYEHV